MGTPSSSQLWQTQLLPSAMRRSSRGRWACEAAGSVPPTTTASHLLRLSWSPKSAARRCVRASAAPTTATEPPRTPSSRKKVQRSVGPQEQAAEWRQQTARARGGRPAGHTRLRTGRARRTASGKAGRSTSWPSGRGKGSVPGHAARPPHGQRS